MRKYYCVSTLFKFSIIPYLHSLHTQTLIWNAHKAKHLSLVPVFATRLSGVSICICWGVVPWQSVAGNTICWDVHSWLCPCHLFRGNYFLLTVKTKNCTTNNLHKYKLNSGCGLTRNICWISHPSSFEYKLISISPGTWLNTIFLNLLFDCNHWREKPTFFASRSGLLHPRV